MSRPNFPGPKGLLPEERDEVTKFEVRDGSISVNQEELAVVTANEIDMLNRLYPELKLLTQELISKASRSNFLFNAEVYLEKYLNSIPGDVKQEDPIKAYIAGRALEIVYKGVKEEDERTGLFDADLEQISVLLDLHDFRMRHMPYWKEFKNHVEGLDFTKEEMQAVDNSTKKVVEELLEMADLVDENVVNALQFPSGLEDVNSVKPESTLTKIRTLENLVIALAKSSTKQLDEASFSDDSVEKSWVADNALSALFKRAIKPLFQKMYRAVGWIVDVSAKFFS